MALRNLAWTVVDRPDRDELHINHISFQDEVSQ
jgi:hypothetical protein